jgi:hypothetical protein
MVGWESALLARAESARQEAEAVRASVRVLEADTSEARARAAALLEHLAVIERKAILAACRTGDANARLALGDIAAVANEVRIEAIGAPIRTSTP